MNIPELTSLAGLAFLIERVVEYFLGQVDPLKPYMRYIALGLGVAVAFLFGVDVTPQLGLHGIGPWVGFLFTGVLLGGGSGLIHDIVQGVRAARERLQPPG